MILALPTIASALSAAMALYFDGHDAAHPSIAPILSFKPQATLTQLATLRTTVVPRSAALSPLTRASLEVDSVVDVGFQIRIDPAGDDEAAQAAAEYAAVVAVMTTVDKVAVWMMTNRVLTGHEDQPLVKLEALPGITTDLEEHRFVTIVLSGTYRSQRGF